MKRILLMTISLLMIGGAVAALATGARQSEDPAVMLRAAIEKEEVDGDLQGAIALYKQIVERHSGQAAVAAKAQLRIGICYEKLGNTEAVKAYEAVLSRFPKEAEAVAEARGRLAALRRPEPEGLDMTRLNVALEFQTLSPDGTKMAGINIDTGQNVAVHDLATEKTTDITNFDWGEKSCSANTPVWSPDSREVAFKASCWGSPETQNASELRSVTLEGKERTLFRNTDGPGIVPCDWLPDKSAVLVFKARGRVDYSLGLVSTKDGSFRELYPLERTYSSGDVPMAEASQSADISPDGRFIAFSDGPPEGSRDIYILSTDGSSKVPLTEHPADDKEPRWSPDGRHVVFLSLRHGSWALWSQAVEDGRPDGLPRLLLDGMQNSQLASWTQSGLLCNKFFVIQEVYIIDVDPKTHEVLGKPRVVDFKPSGTNVCPVWSPDGKHLAFVSRDVDQISEGYLVVMPAEGGPARKFRIPTTHFWNMTLHDLRWMADSSGLGFSHWDNENRRSLFKLDLATGEWKIWPFLSRASGPFAAWRADGKAVYFVKRGEGEEKPALIEWEMETGEERFILSGSRVEAGAAGFNAPMKTSRDHKRILSSAGGAVGILDLDTKKIQTIKWDQGGLGRATFSPDECYVLAVGTVGQGRDQENDLCVVSVNDGQVRKLGVRRMMHPRELFMPPDWSPDGRKIALATRLWQTETNLIRNVIPKK